MLTFHKASALEKYKVLLSADKQTYNYIIRNATWSVYIVNEFQIPKEWLAEQKERLPALDYRFLYFALAALKEYKYNPKIYQGEFTFKRDKKIIQIESHGHDEIFFSNVLDRNNPPAVTFEKLLDFTPYITSGLITKVVEDFPMWNPFSDSYNAQRGGIPGSTKPALLLWVIYAFLADGYHVMLNDPEGTKIPNYYVRSCLQCPSEATHVCGVCKVAQYCSVECQQEAWDNGHKNKCK